MCEGRVGHLIAELTGPGVALNCLPAVITQPETVYDDGELAWHGGWNLWLIYVGCEAVPSGGGWLGGWLATGWLVQ